MKRAPQDFHRQCVILSSLMLWTVPRNMMNDCLGLWRIYENAIPGVSSKPNHKSLGRRVCRSWYKMLAMDFSISHCQYLVIWGRLNPVFAENLVWWLHSLSCRKQNQPVLLALFAANILNKMPVPTATGCWKLSDVIFKWVRLQYEKYFSTKINTTTTRNDISMVQILFYVGCLLEQNRLKTSLNDHRKFLRHLKCEVLRGWVNLGKAIETEKLTHSVLVIPL